MDGWRDGFLAMSLALGDSLDDATACLADADETALVTELRRPDKRARAQALAHGLATIALAMESLEIEIAS
ncbi:MAG: hypothetical protein ABI461_09745 [Polyangiaceae bacterium]